MKKLVEQNLRQIVIEMPKTMVYSISTILDSVKKIG